MRQPQLLVILLDQKFLWYFLPPQNLLFTATYLLQNASRVHDKALALNASEAVEKAAGDLVVAEGLLSESQSLQKNVTDPYLVHALMGLSYR